MFTVYVLYSSLHKKHYTGFSTNFEQRLISHNELGKDWTARYCPWDVIYTKEFQNKIDALQYEKWLKMGVGREFIKTLSN